MNSDIISLIKNGNQDPLCFIYRSYRNEFINWATFNFKCSEAEAKDVFQDSVVAFYENIMSDKLTQLTADVKTYVFAIAKFKLINLAKKNGKTVTLDNYELINGMDDSLETLYEAEHNKKMVEINLQKLEEKEQKILRLYYIEGLDMKKIAEKMGYKNSDVAKKKKYEVLKKLTIIIKTTVKFVML